MIKRLLEEQYAEIINSFLVSNQVIDLSAFNTASEEGNTSIPSIRYIGRSPVQLWLLRWWVWNG